MLVVQLVGQEQTQIIIDFPMIRIPMISIYGIANGSNSNVLIKL
jgi:hypothetical protein